MDKDESLSHRKAVIEKILESPGWTEYLAPWLDEQIERRIEALTTDLSEVDTQKCREAVSVLREIRRKPERDAESLRNQARERGTADAGGMA